MRLDPPARQDRPQHVQVLLEPDSVALKVLSVVVLGHVEVVMKAHSWRHEALGELAQARGQRTGLHEVPLDYGDRFPASMRKGHLLPFGIKAFLRREYGIEAFPRQRGANLLKRHRIGRGAQYPDVVCHGLALFLQGSS